MRPFTITTSVGLRTLLHAQLDRDLPTIEAESSSWEEDLDPEGLHVAAFIHTVDEVCHSLWLVKTAGSMEPRWLWLRTPRDAFQDHVLTQTTLAPSGFA